MIDLKVLLGNFGQRAGSLDCPVFLGRLDYAFEKLVAFDKDQIEHVHILRQSSACEGYNRSPMLTVQSARRASLPHIRAAHLAKLLLVELHVSTLNE